MTTMRQKSTPKLQLLKHTDGKTGADVTATRYYQNNGVINANPKYLLTKSLMMRKTHKSMDTIQI